MTVDFATCVVKKCSTCNVYRGKPWCLTKAMVKKIFPAKVVIKVNLHLAHFFLRNCLLSDGAKNILYACSTELVFRGRIYINLLFVSFQSQDKLGYWLICSITRQGILSGASIASCFIKPHITRSCRVKCIYNCYLSIVSGCWWVFLFPVLCHWQFHRKTNFT